MPWHHFELTDEVVTLGRCQEGELVNVLSVPHLVHSQGVLLELEGLEELVEGQVC